MQHRNIKEKAGCNRHESANSFQLSSLLTLLVASVFLLAASGVARADSQVRAVRLSNISGSVQISLGADVTFSQAYPNMPLTEGARLEAGDDGRAEIQFEDGSVARLTPNSSVSLSALRRDGSGVPVNGIEVLSGLAYFEIGKVREQPFTIEFNNVQVTPSKGTIVRVNLDANPPELSVMHGSAHLSGGSFYEVDVRENQTIKFDASDPARYDTVVGVNGDTWDEWNADRDQALAALSAQETREAALNGGGAGWSDLDYYGNWYSMPGYGNVWSPNGAGMGWDPYGSGYWGYYPGAGYQWISGNPWGWLPYRCGSWNYFNSYGWGWSPNSCGNGWGFGNSFGPGSGGIIVVGAPKNYRLPQRPERPHPVAPGANLPVRAPSIIAVNRGGEASRLDPRPVGIRAPQRVVQVGGQTVTPIAKTINATPQGPAGIVQRSAVTPMGGAASGRVPYTPVSRPYAGPVAPSVTTRAPSYSAPRQAGTPQPSNGGQMRSNGPSYSGGSSGSTHMSSPAPSSSSSSMGGGSHSGGGGPAPSAGSSHK